MTQEVHFFLLMHVMQPRLHFLFRDSSHFAVHVEVSFGNCPTHVEHDQDVIGIVPIHLHTFAKV
jgi:hypothetical protein